MDREIDTRTRNRAQLKRLVVPAAVIASMGLLLLWGIGLLRPPVKRSSIRTAIVDQGPVDASLSATGTVVPQTEQVLSSPVDARLLRVVRKAGTAVSAGDPIVELDVSASVLAVESLGQDLALKANQQARSKLALENTLSELNAQFEIKKLQLESARLEHERKKQLFAEGLTSAEELRRAEVAERQAAIELQRIEASRGNAQESTKTELAGLSLELAKVEKAHQEARRVLGLATPTADRNGVVTWTLTEEGAAVGKGDVVARVADAYASRLSAALPVQIRVDDRVLDGQVTDVLPTVQNGVITVRVALKDPSHAALRPNLRVEVFIVTDHRDRALRVRKGSSTSGEGVQQVFKVYRTDRIETVALSDVNLQVAGGEFLSVMGPSGCGKSTLLNVIGLLDEPTKGRVQLNGTPVQSYRDAALARIRNREIGFIFQTFHLIPDLSVADNVEIPLLYRRMPGSERRKLALAALERVGLTARTHHFPSQLSGGQQQRVAIARAIVGSPRILLADEPTGNLDSQMGDEVMHILHGLQKDSGTTIVMVTHDPRLAEQTSRTVRLFDGRQVQ